MDRVIIAGSLEQIYQGGKTPIEPRKLYVSVAAIKGHEAAWRAAEYLRMAAAVWGHEKGQ